MKAHLFGLVTALAFGLHAPASSAADKKAWMTIGDAAFRQVRRFVPSIASVDARQLAGSGEKIHAVSVSEAQLEYRGDDSYAVGFSQSLLQKPVRCRRIELAGGEMDRDRCGTVGYHG